MAVRYYMGEFQGNSCDNDVYINVPMQIYPTTQIGVLFDFEGGGPKILCKNPYFFFTF